jgi:hypothetical protein
VPNPPAQPSSILSARHLPSYRAELAAKRKLERDAQLQAQAQIPDRVLSGLAALGCTEPEIQHLLACSPDFLASKSDILASGSARLKHSLRRAQLRAALALKGNASMLIWLGKTYLGQKDSPDSQVSQQTNIVVDSKLLASLQASYQETLQDFRRTKALPLPDKLSSDPDKQPALSDVPASNESGTVAPIPNEGEPLSSEPISLPISHSEPTICNSLTLSV